MNRLKQSPAEARRHEPAVGDFVRSLGDLRERSCLVVELGRQGIRKGVIELDDGTGDIQRRILVLMDSVESSFRTIRRKLGA